MPKTTKCRLSHRTSGGSSGGSCDIATAEGHRSPVIARHSSLRQRRRAHRHYTRGGGREGGGRGEGGYAAIRPCAARTTPATFFIAFVIGSSRARVRALSRREVNAPGQHSSARRNDDDDDNDDDPRPRPRPRPRHPAAVFSSFARPCARLGYARRSRQTNFQLPTRCDDFHCCSVAASSTIFLGAAVTSPSAMFLFNSLDISVGLPARISRVSRVYFPSRWLAK